MSSELQLILQNLEYPKCAMEALTRIESLVLNRAKQDFAMDLIAEFVFLEKRKTTGYPQQLIVSQPPPMSLLQELQLVIVLCEFFSRPGPDMTRNAMFLCLFGGTITQNRTNVLVKLISTSVSGSIAPLLCAAGAWMQQLGCTSILSSELAQNLVKDFVIFSNKTSEQLKQLPLVAPRFAANFMTAVADLYMNDLKGPIIPPPDMLLEVFTDWVTESPSLSLASQQPLALPPGAIAMPVVTPLAGLIRWCVLAPIICPKGTYNKLHLAILETLLQIPPPNGPATVLNAQHLSLIVNPLKSHARKLIEGGINPEHDEHFQNSLERFAQSVQVALASKCIYGSIPQLLCLLEILPTNTLMDIVIKSHKNT